VYGVPLISLHLFVRDDTSTCNLHMHCMGTSYMCNYHLGLTVWLSAQYNEKCSAVHFHNYSGMSQFRPRPRPRGSYATLRHVNWTSFIIIIIIISLSLDSGYCVASTKLAANRNCSTFDFGELIDQLSEFYLAQHLVFRLGSSTLGDSIVLDALLNVARSWCVLASRRNVRLNSLSTLLGTNKFVIRLRCSEKLSADLHLSSAWIFVALQTQLIGVVRQPVFPNSS